MLRGAARGGLLNLAGAAVAGATGFAATWLVVRGITDPHRVGAFFTAVAVFTLAVGVAKLGSQTSLVYWPARLRALGARQELPRCLRHGLAPIAGAAVVSAVAIWAAAGLVHTAMVGPLRILVLFLPLAVLTDALLAATRGYRRMGATVVLDRFLRPVLQLAGLGALILVATATGGTLTPGAAAAAWVGPYLPVLVLAGYALVRSHHLDHSDEGRAVFSARGYWAFTAPRAVASVAQIALQRIDMLLVAAWGGLPAAALYAVAGKYVVLGQMAAGGLAQSAQPRLAERLAVDDLAGARTLYQQATAWQVLVTWPLHLLVAANAGQYLGLFGSAYRGGRPVVWLLAAAMLVATACGMVDMVLAMAGRTRWNLYNVLLALIMMIAVDVLLIPRFGAAGAAAGLAAAVLVNNLMPLAQIYRMFGLHPFGAATLRAMALAAGCCGVPPLVATALGAGAAALAAVSGAALLSFVACAYLSRRSMQLHMVKGVRR